MTRFAVSVGLTLLLSSSPLGAQDARHPMDPLSFEEHWALLDVLHESGRLDGETRFSFVTLQEPAKDLVRSWREGDPVPRSAFAVVRQGKEAFEAVVDLGARRVVAWERISGEQPSWTGEEFGSVADVVKEHPDFLAAMKRRGYDDLTFVECEAVAPGFFGTDEQRGRNVGHVHCQDVRHRRNTWTRQIAGLTAVVDMTEKKVLRVVDEGVVPLPEVSADYDPASVGGLREPAEPIRIEQPLGPSFRRDGHRVEWQRWRFHVRPDQRVGPVVSVVSYRDGERDRAVLYQGHLSEIFVPYMDPAFAWYARNFIDAGEFPAGGLTKPLLPGRDCPANAAYLDMVYADDKGRPVTVPNNICLFERLDGDPSWRHWAAEPESRPKRDLVVRSAAVLGNYDYVLDWVFLSNGSIKVRVGATGIAEVKLVNQATAADGGEEPADAYGHFVDPHVVAVNHDHYFSFRLDLDVDGPTNSFVADRLVTRTLPPDHPRRSIWVVDPAPAERESQAKMRINLSKPKLWRVVSDDRTNHVGYPTSYQIMPGKNANTLMSEDDYPRRRAGFIDHHLWVTPYRPDERYAAGLHPTLSEPGKGLPEWTKADRGIARADIVVWYTVGMHHLVRGEDWPVMPVAWHDFEIRPFDFFDHNPAVDLPETP